MRPSRPRLPVCLAALALAACASAPRAPRATRVDREERVSVTDPTRDAFFARLHGVQTVLAAMELERARAQAALARALGLRADADRGEVSVALARRVAPEGQAPRIGFGAELPPDRNADALEGWEAALGDDARRARAFASLMERARVQAVSDRRCPDLMVSLREASTLARLALAQSAVTPVLARVSEALAATAAEQSRSGPPTLREEYVAAGRWLESAPVRLDLQRQAADQTVLWIRGVLHPEAEEEHGVQEIGCPLP